jgi:RecB family exonuclease
MQFSYSKLKTFGDCALKYRLTYVERVPRPPVRSLAFHRRMHAALARYHTFARRDGMVDLPEILSAYDGLWQAERDPEIRQSKAYREGEEILRLYHRTEARSGRVPAVLEHKIRVAVGPYTLTGAIDRLDFTAGGGYSLIDYKLDRSLPQANSAESSPQLSFYHLLVYESMGVAPEDVRLYYLRHGVEHISTRDGRQMAEVTAWIDEIASRIREERRWLPCEGDVCRMCAFWSLCPAKTGRERPPEPVWRQGELVDVSDEGEAPGASDAETELSDAQLTLDLPGLS